MSMAPSSSARSKVNVPALLLIINAVIFMAVDVGVFLFAPAAMSGLFDSLNKLQQEQAAKTGQPVQQIQVPPDMGRPWVSTILALVGGGFIIFGAMKMRNLESWGIALAATIVSMVPYASPCCCSGIFIGIYGLVVLMNSEVKAAFRS
jgi:hypothetical protein